MIGNDLVYIKQLPGIQRKKEGKIFVYYNSKGKKITEPKTLERIKSLAIPPAFTHVWICPNEKGHIQAIGKDAKKRKQYIYHPLWIQTRQEQKFKSLLQFGYSLSVLRKKIMRKFEGLTLLVKTKLFVLFYF